MTIILATIRDRNERAISRIEACLEAQELVVRLVHESQSWQDKLAELEQRKLRLMIDGLIYLERTNCDAKELQSLETWVKEFSNQELHVAYDPAGIERGHQLKREIAKQSDQWVPFTDLLEILRQSSPAG